MCIVHDILCSNQKFIEHTHTAKCKYSGRAEMQMIMESITIGRGLTIIMHMHRSLQPKIDQVDIFSHLPVAPMGE